MKTNISNFASRLAMLALAVCMIMSFTACSSSDGEDDDSIEKYPSKLVGTWYKTFKDGTTYEMIFYHGGDGSHHNSTGTLRGTFKWAVTSPGFLYCKKWFYYDDNITTSEYGWQYRIEDNTLWLDNEEYTRR